MGKHLELCNELSELNPLVGKWTITGSFKSNPDKRVEGWERYTVQEKGSVLFCETEIFTIRANDKEVYKTTLNIAYDKEKAKIIGDEEWEFSLAKGVLIIKNQNMRFTGKMNESKDIISGKWEVLDKTGAWNYWYDKILEKS